ncbi:MAG: sigma-70 family RNA polymerase sigma factor [Spirochaetota bacterium]
MNNDSYAYNEFMKKYSKLILFLCNKSCGNIYDADELCNDIIYKIFIKMNSYDSCKGKLTTWINTIASNYLRDNMRKDDPSENEVSIERYLENENIREEPYAAEYFKNELPERLYAEANNVPADKLYTNYHTEFGKEFHDSNEDEAIIRLQNAMKEISERDQLILKFRSEGFEYNEIAELLKISYKTATTTHSRAVKKVKAEYSKGYELSQN